MFRKYQRQLRDGLTALFLIAAFVTLMWGPFYWVYAHLEASRLSSVGGLEYDFRRLNSIFSIKEYLSSHLERALPGLFLALAFFARRAQTIKYGLIFPLGFTIIYLALDYFVFSYIGLYFNRWWAAIPLIILASLPYYLLMRKWYSEGLDLDHSITEMVFLLSIIIIPHILFTFMNSMGLVFGPYH